MSYKVINNVAEFLFNKQKRIQHKCIFKKNSLSFEKINHLLYDIIRTTDINDTEEIGSHLHETQAMKAK